MKKSRDQTPYTSMCAQREEGNETTGFACMKLRLSTIYQNFRKIRLESKWYTTFWAFYRKISGNKKTSEKVVLFFRTEYSYIPLNQIWNSCSISSKPSLKPGSGLRGRFLENGTDLYRDGKRDSGTIRGKDLNQFVTFISNNNITSII